jgi:hypothetical protein
VIERVWHFHCPTCGFGDFELGFLAADQELVCEVCLEEGRGMVWLTRWLEEAVEREAVAPRRLAA